MKKKIKKGAIFVAALLFFAAGIIGSLLPILPGFVFIAIAFILLSIISLSFKTYVDHHTSKYPKIHQLVGKLDTAVRRVVGEV